MPDLTRSRSPAVGHKRRALRKARRGQADHAAFAWDGRSRGTSSRAGSSYRPARCTLTLEDRTAIGAAFAAWETACRERQPQRPACHAWPAMTAAEVYAWTLISLARAQRRPGGMFRRVGRYEDRPAIKGSRSQDRRTDRLGRVDRRGHVTVDRLGEQGEPDWSRASVDTMSVRARLARGRRHRARAAAHPRLDRRDLAQRPHQPASRKILDRLRPLTPLGIDHLVVAHPGVEVGVDDVDQQVHEGDHQ